MTGRSGNKETVGSKAGELYSRQMHIAAKHLNRAAFWKPGEVGENSAGMEEVTGRGKNTGRHLAWETCRC